MDNILQQVLAAIVQRLVETYDPEKIILFGSRAWGISDEESDIDLLIIKKTNKRPRDRRVEVRSLLKPITRPVGLDLLVVTPGELRRRVSLRDPFYLEILNRGKMLYERKQLVRVS